VSDTPRTDAKAQFFGWNPDEGEEFVTASFCRELERENAALRSALTTLLAWEDTGGDIPPTAARGLFRIARAALDSARKEAQP
jgi:hypothetical protein